MDRSRGGGGPAVLQLRKWSPSQAEQLDLSQFREGFISPTRELLLLLSHQSEAMLLPIGAGGSVDSINSEVCGHNDLQHSENTRSSHSLNTSTSGSGTRGSDDDFVNGSDSLRSSDFRHSETSHRLDSMHASTPGSETRLSDGDSFGGCDYISEPNGYPFVCGVNSLAWGVCGDSYSKHEDALYREFLFVSGSHGVTVHAFCHPRGRGMKMTQEGDLGSGNWVEWGPSLNFFDRYGQGSPNLCSDASRSARDVNKMNGTLKTKQNLSEEGVNGCLSSKRWLQTFLTSVETVECKGKVLTRFPENESIPSCAKVVSFSIFAGRSLFMDASTCSSSSHNKEDAADDAHDKFNLGSRSESLPDVLSNYLNIGKKNLFKCSRIISSSSHRYIGFVLSVLETEGSNVGVDEVLIVVARLDDMALHWACSVKLVNSFNEGLRVDWVDFQFADNLLACLRESGLVSFYSAITGEYITHVDILRICGVISVSNICDQKNFPVERFLPPSSNDVQIEQFNVDHDKSTQMIWYGCGKIMFKRLVVASYASFLAAIDEHGVFYIICAGDYVPDKFYSYDKLLPHFQHFGLGILAGWKVGGSEISQQKAFSYQSGGKTSSFSSSMQVHSEGFKRSLEHKIIQNKNVHGNLATTLYDSDLSDSSPTLERRDQTYPGSGSLSRFMRKIFLPWDRSDDDIICFSPLGVTRLIMKHDAEGKRSFRILHSNLHVELMVRDDRCLLSTCKVNNLFGIEEASVGEAMEAVGCAFHGVLYLVTKNGLSVVLPSVSVSSDFLPIEYVGFRQQSINMGIGHQVGSIFTSKENIEPCSPWKLEVMDRILAYEGPEEADNLCLENGWDQKISRMRHLQLALEFLKFEDIQKSLERLVSVNLAEDGILRLLLAAAYLMLSRIGNESELSAASRLLALGALFATKMIRMYGLVIQKKDAVIVEGARAVPICSQTSSFMRNEEKGGEDFKKLEEMAYYLEAIRNVQCRLNAKYDRRGQGLGNDVEKGLGLQDDAHLLDLHADTTLLETPNQQDLSLPSSSLDVNDAEQFALVPSDALELDGHVDSEGYRKMSALVSQGEVHGSKVLTFENPRDMIARWGLGNMDLRAVVKDALHSGRLPLAVLQLHLSHLKDLDSVSDKEPYDTFAEVRHVGRAIAYELFLEGESALAVATLQRLGEDLETSLKHLAFGAVRRPLRVLLAKELERYGYLGLHEFKILERMSVIERFYPCSGFWRTFIGRQKEVLGASSSLTSPRERSLRLRHSHSSTNFVIECGEIDGVVLGSWMNVSSKPADLVVAEDYTNAGYWAAAAVWSDAWDQKTVDRIVLDQPPNSANVLWESQLEYFLCHNNWGEVSKLLDTMPIYLLADGSLQISLDGLNSASNVGGSRASPDYGSYICSSDELDGVFADVPDVKIFKLSVKNMCSTWLRMLMEQKLAKKFVFLKEYWDSTQEIVSLLSLSGFITSNYGCSYQDKYSESSSDWISANINRTKAADVVQSFHRLVVRHCTLHNLPNLLDLYLDHHNLALDNDSLNSLQDAAGDCQWAKWLLLSRIRGREFDASFSNAHSIMSHNVVASSNLSVLEIEEIIKTVDDIAEGGGEMAALATLMFAPVPMQNCLSTGSVNRSSSSSAQCTLENLRPALQHFPTLWRSLVAACLGQDTSCSFLGPSMRNVFGSFALSDYLNWRMKIFFSSGCDTSLSQMLPSWFSRAVRRLIQLYVQGPLGWHSLAGVSTAGAFMHRENDFILNSTEDIEISAVSWEAAVEKHIEEELYASSLKETGPGLEPHLHRGRALAAFNHLLGVRVQKLKSVSAHKASSDSSGQGQTNVQLDVQTLLAHITESEAAQLSSVKPLAIMHFEDSVLVASCAFLLELCGLSVSMLRVDIAALRRISSFHKLRENADSYGQRSSNGSVYNALTDECDIAYSLARALADEYVRNDGPDTAKKIGGLNSFSGEQPSPVLMLVLQHLEKASLPPKSDDKSCGSWLVSSNGDGIDLRSQQKAESQHWNLVTVFCQMHRIPLSTKYLSVLARDNDWVGFLLEAQVGGYALDTLIEIVSKEFSDPRLKIHILTVLRGLSRKKLTSSSNSETIEKKSRTSLLGEYKYMPVELFGILAECEKQENPGEALLVRAKELCWSLLAMIASCFPDVSPLSCLTVWLEITAARETSSIKVNDTASQVTANVGAAVESTNSLPVGSRALTVHYNRRNPKRRRLMESISVNTLASTVTHVPSTSDKAGVFSAQGSMAEVEKKLKPCEHNHVSADSDEGHISLAKMVAVLCEQLLFLPLLRAFEMFLPSCSLLPFIRALQAFSQMRISEASAHLGSFSARIKEESLHLQAGLTKEEHIGISWIASTARNAADAVLSTCPSPYEKRSLLQLLAATDFGDGGSAATYYQQIFWKINLAEPSIRNNDVLHLGNETFDDASLLTALEKNGHWEHARNWARQLEASGGPWRSAVHHVTETQAESMVAEWKEFLWDVPEERVALWSHCQMLFLRYSFPPLQAGLFFLKHAETVEKDLPAREVHELLLVSLQWLSGMMTLSNPVYPLHLLREIETRVWLLAVESETQVKSEGGYLLSGSSREPASSNGCNIIDRTASIIAKMDNHINTMRNKCIEKNDARELSQAHTKNSLAVDAGFSASAGGATKTKRRAKGNAPLRRAVMDSADKSTTTGDGSSPLTSKNGSSSQDDNFSLETSFSGWEERIGPVELEKAVLSLLEFGQITAAKQLQHKLSPAQMPSEFVIVSAALKLATMSTMICEVSKSELDEEVRFVMESHNIMINSDFVDPLQVLGSFATILTEGSGRGLCKRIIAVVKAAKTLGLSFQEAFDKAPIEVLQLLSLKAQDSFEEAHLLVQNHSMPAASIAQILAESFLKGLLAAHRGGYMDSQKEEGPAPLLWRFSDFLKWAELCPSEPEIGHALMRLVITGQEIPHACEVELLILSHHFYKSSACLDGVDVLVALAATRVEAYVSEGDFTCLARLITGVGNFHALNFILGILIENGQLDLLLQKFSAVADTNTGTAEAVRGFRMAVLTSLKHYNPNDLDAFALVYNHFDMKHETAALLESRAEHSSRCWFLHNDKDQNEDLLESMRYYIEAAVVHSSIDAGNKTRAACAQASLVSLQIRMPDVQWLNLSETNARRTLVEQSRFQEALIVAEAYYLNWPSEWALVLWNQMLKPELTEQFVAEFVAVLPLQPSMLVDLSRFYRAEVAARGDQSQFSVWLTGGGFPAEWAKYLGRSFRCLLKRTRDLRLRLQLATVATGFSDVIDACAKALDKVPDCAGPLVLRKGHGGAYLPLM